MTLTTFLKEGVGGVSRLVKITDEVFVNPDEVAAIEYSEQWEHDPSPSGSSHRTGTGTLLILKNGRKIYLANMGTDEVAEKFSLELK